MRRFGRDEDRAALDVMLRFSDKLAQGYALKEAIFHFMTAPDRTKAGRRLDFWLDTCDRLRPPLSSSPAEQCCSTGAIPSLIPLTSVFPTASQRAVTTPSKRSKGLPLDIRTSTASVRKFWYHSFYTPTFDAEPKNKEPRHCINIGVPWWRRRRDSNPRTAFDRYAISSRAPSTKLGDSSIHIFFCANPERSNPKPKSVNAN